MLGCTAVAFANGTIEESGDIDKVIKDPGKSSSTITVPNIGVSALTNVMIGVRISHPNDADLTIKVRSPQGTSVTLAKHRGGSGDNYGDGATGCNGMTFFWDGSVKKISHGVAPFTFNGNTFRPEQPLSTFDGENPTGDWELTIKDDVEGNQGILHCWNLDVSDE